MKEKLEVLDKIINNKTKTTHTVEHIESVDGCIVVYTLDSKCFPIEVITILKKNYDIGVEELFVEKFFNLDDIDHAKISQKIYGDSKIKKNFLFSFFSFL